MTAADYYFSDFEARLVDLRTTQAEAVEAAARLVAGSLVAAQPIHIYDTGHLISHEFLDRTGGLAAYTAVTFPAVTAPNEWIAANRPDGGPGGAVERLFAQGAVQPGDVLVLSSVSGTNSLIVELATQARSRGIAVVAVTGREFSAALQSGHPSGKRLFEVADVVLDNRVPYGDATLELAGLEARVAAWSGVAGATLMWAVTSRAIELALEQGVTPTVYTSYNLPGGGDAYQASRARYREGGR